MISLLDFSVFLVIYKLSSSVCLSYALLFLMLRNAIALKPSKTDFQCFPSGFTSEDLDVGISIGSPGAPALRQPWPDAPAQPTTRPKQ